MRKGIPALLLTLSLLLCGCRLLPERIPPAGLTVHFIDVGQADCALLEPDGITILDFKTDRVPVSGIPKAAERYRLQVQTYGEALSRIYEMPIKASFLYFFHTDTLWPV